MSSAPTLPHLLRVARLPRLSSHRSTLSRAEAYEKNRAVQFAPRPGPQASNDPSPPAHTHVTASRSVAAFYKPCFNRRAIVKEAWTLSTSARVIDRAPHQRTTDVVQILLPPAPGIRIGVSGTRFLGEDTGARLSDLGCKAFSILAETCRGVAYGRPPARAPRLRCLTSLAEGSDRILAVAALTQGYSLHAVLPFAVAEFALDFPDTRAEFDRLLAQAGDNVFVIDGDRQERRTDSYEAATRWLVGNADILFASWDGRAAHNRGGTAHAARIALSRFVPVLWLPTGDGEPRLLRSLADFYRTGEPSAAGRSWQDDLCAWGRAVLVPPSEAPLEASWLGRLVRRWAGRNDRPPQSRLWNLQWRLEQLFLKKARKPARRDEPLSSQTTVPPVGPSSSEWKGLRERAHALAMGYSRGYRTTFTLAVALGGAALVAAFLALVLPELKLVLTVGELLCLLTISVLIDQAGAEAWHPRFVVARAVAEQSRLPEYRSVVGLPTGHSPAPAYSSAIDPIPADESGPQDPASWVLGAWARWLDLPTGPLKGAIITGLHASLLHKLVAGQAKYLGDSASKNHRLDHRFEAFALWFFKATLVLLVVKASLVAAHAAHEAVTALAVALAVLPALSAVLFGLRAYAEYGPTSRRYLRTRGTLERIRHDLAALQPDHPLASQELAWFVERVSRALQADVEQWSDLTASKTLSKEA